MKTWFTYIVQCSDNTLYIGTTNNLEKRVAKHNAGKGAKYTKGRTPVIIRYSCSFASRAEACRFEYTLKQLSKKEKIGIIQKGINDISQ